MNDDRNKGFSALVFVPGLALLVAIIVIMLLTANADSGVHPVATWTPRPTGVPTREAFLPLVERGGKSIATVMPRPQEIE